MSDSDYAKKLVEEMELEPFLEEYEHVTGTSISVVARSERPDFLCKRGGRRVGLELVRVMQDPSHRQWKAILGQDEQMHGLDAALLVREAVYAKELRRAPQGWQYPDRTILVVQLMDADGQETVEHLDDQIMEEMAATGFREIWLADYTLMEPYRTVQLVGIKPKRWRGPHLHRFYGLKPYG